jgi:hypothetical protein
VKNVPVNFAFRFHVYCLSIGIAQIHDEIACTADRPYS